MVGVMQEKVISVLWFPELNPETHPPVNYKGSEGFFLSSLDLNPKIT